MLRTTETLGVDAAIPRQALMLASSRAAKRAHILHAVGMRQSLALLLDCCRDVEAK